MKKNDWILIIAVILYSWMFYQQTPGINFLIFSAAAILLLIWREPSVLKDSRWYVAASGTLVSGICVALFGTAVSVVANVVSLSLMSAMAISKRSSVVLAGLYAVYSYLSAIGFMIADLVRRRNGKGQSRGSRFWIRLGIGAGIVIIVVIFFILYQRSNPLFLDLTRKIKLDFISWPWVRFTFLGFVILYGFFYHRNFPSWLRWDAARPPMLDASQVMGRENRIFGRPVNVKWEISSGLILLVLLNLLLLVVNVLDLYYLWITGELPSGMTYSESVHQGTTNMIISIVIAILIILFFFRGHINFSAQSKAIKAMAILWIAQNIMVLVSTGFRNYLYVAEYNLTYRRIGVYIWLVLTLVGLITTFIKIYGKKTNWYLFRSNGWAFYIVLVLFACQNWDLVITKFNIQKSKHVDKYYLLSLESPAVIPELLALPADSNKLPEGIPAEYESRFTAYRDYKDWDAPYFREDFNDELNRRMYQFLASHEEDGWQSWNRQDQETARKIYRLSEEGIFTRLSLTNMELDSLRFINVFNKIETLDLSNNHLKSFQELASFPKLKELKLGTNQLYTTADLPNIASLRKLWLNNNYITDYSGLSKMKQLEYLNLSSNSGSIDLKVIRDLKKLQELDLNGTRVEDLSLLSEFPALLHLNLGGQPAADFTKLPVMSKLESIDLSGNSLGTNKAGLIMIFKDFSSLKKINLQNNSIGSLYLLTTYYSEYSGRSSFYSKPEAVQPVFTHLEELDISGNTILDADPLAYYPMLKRLDISYNGLNDAGAIADLKNLEYLNMAGTQITTLDSLMGLEKLKELDISSSYVNNIDAIAYLKNLETFSASNCQITNFAPLRQLPKLRVLQISNTYTPDLNFLKGMNRLEVLYMAGNTSVTDFSPLYELPALKVLYLDSYMSKKQKRELEDRLPGVRIYYGYYNSYDYSY